MLLFFYQINKNDLKVDVKVKDFFIFNPLHNLIPCSSIHNKFEILKYKIIIDSDFNYYSIYNKNDVSLHDRCAYFNSQFN